MSITFYWDFLFIQNFCVWCCSLWIASYINRENDKAIRKIMGAGWNSLLFLLSIFHPVFLRGWIGIGYWIGASVGTILIAFGKKEFWRHWFYSTTAMFLIGSVMFFLKENCRILNLTVISWFCIFLGSIVVILVWIRLEKRNQCIKSNVLEMVLERNGKYMKINAYCDTGNLLRDPYSGRSVMILQCNKAKEYLNDEAKQLIEHFERTGKIEYSALAKESLRPFGFHLVPYQSLGVCKGIALGFYIPRVWFPEMHLVIKKQPVILAQDGLLRGDTYQAIINEKALYR